VTTPKPCSPLAEIEVPKGVVDACGLPVKNARELPIDDKKLVLVDVAVNENMGQLRGHLHLLAPPFASTAASEAIGRLGNGLSSGTGVKGSAEPANIGAIVVGGRSGAGHLGRRDFMPLGDGAAKLVEQITRVGWVSARKSGNSSEGIGIDGFVPPFPEQPGNNGESYRFERSVRGQLAFKPLDAVRSRGNKYARSVPRRTNLFQPVKSTSSCPSPIWTNSRKRFRRGGMRTAHKGSPVTTGYASDGPSRSQRLPATSRNTATLPYDSVRGGFTNSSLLDTIRPKA